MSRKQTNTHKVFDLRSVTQHQHRASKVFEHHNFIFREVGKQLCDRLNDINRKFATALEVGARGNILTTALLQSGAKERCEITHFFRFGPDGDVRSEYEILPIATDSIDLVLSNLALHWLNDLPGTLLQLRKALRPDGLMLATLFGGNTLSELRNVLEKAEMELDGGVRPRVSPFIDVRTGGDLLQRAGFALIVTDIDSITVTYPDLYSLIRDIRGMGETNALIDRPKTFTTRKLLEHAEKLYKNTFSDQRGKLVATYQVLYLAGWAPHHSQQKPLQPGSATHSLTSVIGKNK